ncbi:hypothetical protein RFI_28533, partial [Reticulomyxa filosa]
TVIKSLYYLLDLLIIGKKRHTLVMKYISVWSNILDTTNKPNELSNYNEWVPFTDNHNQPIIIGRNENYNYEGLRAVIGGINNHLLFITYLPKDISVFDLNKFQFIKHDNLPSYNSIQFHCFVLNSENGQVQETMKTNKQNYQMLLFKERTGLSIEYNEDSNTFQFHKLPVCDSIAPFSYYAYVNFYDTILFFGGWNSRYGTNAVSKLVHKYSIRENKWMTFENILPSPLYSCVAILNKEDSYIHIIGGRDDKYASLLNHIKIKIRVFDPSVLVMILDTYKVYKICVKLPFYFNIEVPFFVFEHSLKITKKLNSCFQSFVEKSSISSILHHQKRS